MIAYAFLCEVVSLLVAIFGILRVRAAVYLLLSDVTFRPRNFDGVGAFLNDKTVED